MDEFRQTPLTVDAVTDAAATLIAEGCSLDGLSRRLDCAPDELDHCFPDGVDAINCAVQALESRRLLRWITDADDDPQYPGLGNLDRLSRAARLTRRCCAYLNFVDANPIAYRHLFAHPSTRRAPEAASVVTTMIEGTAKIIQEAARMGELNRPMIGGFDAMRLAHLIWVQLHGFADLSISGMDQGQIYQFRLPLLVNLLFFVGFRIAATPAGFEAAARNAAAAADEGFARKFA